MGIININDNSFYSKSREKDPRKICSRAISFLGDACTMIDLGACSTRPGCTPISQEEEIALLKEPLKELKTTLLEHLAQKGADISNNVNPFRNLISIDTFRSAVVEMAYEILGEFTVNDISAGEADPEMLPTVARLNLPYIAMYNTPSQENTGEKCAQDKAEQNVQETVHKNITGFTPKCSASCQEQNFQNSIVERTINYFKDFQRIAEEKGIKEWVLDPGFGFGKTLEENYMLLRNLESLKQFGVPVLVGLSRKSMIYKLLNTTPDASLNATTALNFYALTKGADILRVHDAAPAAECIRLYKALKLNEKQQ